MPFRRPWSPWGAPRLPWAPNPDEADEALRRRASAGDANAARALAQSLLRKGRLTVQELALIGSPAAEILPPDLKQGIVQALAPITVWSVVVTWDDPARGPGRMTRPYLSEAAAQADAGTRSAEVVVRALGEQDFEHLEPDDQEALEQARLVPDLIAEGRPFDAWIAGRNALYNMESDYNEEQAEIDIHESTLG